MLRCLRGLFARFLIGDGDLCPDRDLLEQRLRKTMRHAHAAVRNRMIRNVARVHGKTVPCQAEHKGHRCVAVPVRAMESFFLENVERTGWRFVSASAGRDRADADKSIVAINKCALCAKIDHYAHRSGWRQIGTPDKLSRVEVSCDGYAQ